MWEIEDEGQRLSSAGEEWSVSETEAYPVSIARADTESATDGSDRLSATWWDRVHAYLLRSTCFNS